MNEDASREALDQSIPESLRTLLADAADTVFIMGNDFRPTFCSSPDGTLFGRSIETWQPGTLGELLHPGDQVWLKKKRHEILSMPDARVSGRVRLRDADGNYQSVLLTARNRFDDPTINGLVITVAATRDESEEGPAKDEVRRASAAKRQTELLSQFQSKIQMAIAGIDEATGSLAAMNDTDAVAHVTAIRRATRTLGSLLHDIVDLSKVSTGTMELESVVFSPAHLLNDLVTVFEPSCAQRGLDLELHIENELPSKLKGDPGRLEQVLRHLISNAIDASPSGSVSIDVSLREETRIRFRISDTSDGSLTGLGPGIFDSLGSNRRTTRDADAGMAIALQIIELMDGSFGYETSDQGTALWFDVAFGHARRIADRPTTPPPIAPVSETSAHVLVVDDSDVNRLLATSQLQRLGHTFATAESGQVALDMMVSDRFDAVLMDWHMPGLDGLEATRRWRAEHDPTHRLPIITMTASAMAGDKERCLDAGASDYLSKPVSINDLGNMLTRWTRPQSSTDETPSRTADIETSEFNTSRISALISDLGDLNVVRSIVRAFLGMVPQYRSDAEAALAEGERMTVRRCAHTLKSTAVMLGADELAEACIMLEAAAVSDEALVDPAQFALLVQEFVHCCDRAELTLTDLTEQLEAVDDISR